MATYFANFYANNGTHYMNPITDTNKARLIKDIRLIAEGERFLGNTCSWRVWIESDGYYIKIASGGLNENGKRWRDDSEEIFF